jgi:hypothetical protein
MLENMESVLNNVLYVWSKSNNTLYSGQKVYCFANLFAVLLSCLVANRMLLIHPQFSPITDIKLCNCIKVTIGLMVKSLSGFLPLRQLSEEGRNYLCSDWVY